MNSPRSFWFQFFSDSDFVILCNIPRFPTYILDSRDSKYSASCSFNFENKFDFSGSCSICSIFQTFGFFIKTFLRWQQWDLNPQVDKRTLNHLSKWLSVYLRTKWLWVWIPLLSLKLQIWGLLRARNSLTFTQNIEIGFTLELVHDIIITYSQNFS